LMTFTSIRQTQAGILFLYNDVGRYIKETLFVAS